MSRVGALPQGGGQGFERRPGRRRLLALCVASVAGCAALQAPPWPADAVLSGRLSVRVEGQPDRSVNAAFDLSGTAREGQLLLSGPLGAGAARARWSPGQAWLQVGSQETRHDDLDALATAALGEPVPIAALFDWLRGRAWSGAPASARADGVAGFEQLGWRVDLTRWADGWIEAVRAAPPVITVRARLEPAG